MMQIFIQDVEICAGRGEDAYIYRVVYHLIAEDEKGRRWVHFARFNDEARVTKFFQRVIAAMDAGRQLNFNHWHEMDPAYGSEAYQELACEGVFRAAEIREDQEFWKGGPNDISWVC